MTNNVWGYFLSTNLFFSSKKIFLTKFQKIALERNFDLEQKKNFFLKITDYVATIRQHHLQETVSYHNIQDSTISSGSSSKFDHNCHTKFLFALHFFLFREKNESVEIVIFNKVPLSCRLIVVLKRVEKCLEIIYVHQNSHIYDCRKRQRG